MNRLLALLVLAFCIMVPSIAQAGTYTIAYPAAGQSGWGVGGSGHYVCVAATCGGAGATRGLGYGAWINRAHAYARGENNWLAWSPPANTSLVQVNLGWAAQVDNYNYKQISFTNSNGAYYLTDTVGKLQSDIRSGDARSFAGGIADGFKLNIVSKLASTSNQLTAQNGITIQGANMVVEDNSRPIITALSAPAWGDAARWITDSSTQCVTANATDTGGGITSADLYTKDGVIARGDISSGSPYTPGLLAGNGFQLCVNTATLPEGSTPMSFYLTDAAGNWGGSDLGSISVERTPARIGQLERPAGDVFYTPAPLLRFSVTTPISGLAASTLTIDGAAVALPVSSGLAAYQPTLAEGPHAWSYTVASNAGLVTTASGTFTVSLPPPVVKATSVPSGQISDATPGFVFDMFDAHFDRGIPVMHLDGHVVPLVRVVGNLCTFQIPTALADGAHSWTVTIANSAGKSTTLSGTFTLVKPVAVSGSTLSGPATSSSPGGSTASSSPSGSAAWSTPSGLAASSSPSGSGVSSSSSGSSASLFLSVQRIVRAIHGHRVLVRATVFKGGRVLEGRRVMCSINGRRVSTATTDSRGVARCVILAQRTVYVGVRTLGATSRHVHLIVS